MQLIKTSLNLLIYLRRYRSLISIKINLSCAKVFVSYSDTLIQLMGLIFYRQLSLRDKSYSIIVNDFVRGKFQITAPFIYKKKFVY